MFDCGCPFPKILALGDEFLVALSAPSNRQKKTGNLLAPGFYSMVRQKGLEPPTY